MEDSNLQRLPSSRPLGLDDQQLGPTFDPDDPHSFAPFRTAIDSVDSHQHQSLQNASHSANPSPFIRPPRPGEPMNTLLQQQQQQQQSPSHQDQHESGITAHLHPQQQSSAHAGFRGSRELGNGFTKGQIGITGPMGQILDGSACAHMSPAGPLSQSGIPLTGDAQETQNSGIATLQSVEPFQQPNFVELGSDSVAAQNFAGQLQGMKLVPDPPELEYWRDRLFHVDEMITLSEEEFQTYFPHVDNVYSHRSTQRYKRKPFVSHYWDCRLKGRPPGTPKSDDPTKKKRKRSARERDLCDVKIKIIEYFPGSGASDFTGGMESLSHDLLTGVKPLFSSSADNVQPLGLLTPKILPEGHPGANGGRYFTIQRVNGNGANGKNDGCPGGHRHTLEESDRVKKNSVQRHFLKETKERKKAAAHQTMTDAQQKSYHTKATGEAAQTVINHSAESDLKLYGSCFCPFVQRVWIALELKGVPYQYIEVDPYQKPQSLLEVNPRGLVPALRHGEWGCYESTVLLEYLEDINLGKSLLPSDAKLRAHCRLWADHINRHIVPNFYRVLQEQEQQKQIAHTQELRNALNQLLNVAHPRGPFFMGPQISFVDVQAAPWILRLRRVLTPYRGWSDGEDSSRLAVWVNAIEANEHIRSTTSTDELYLDSYERYAQNRPNTSQVANAINSGRNLP